MKTNPPRQSPLPEIPRQRLVPYFFFAVFIFLLWQIIRLLAPFYVALLGAGILALLFHPMHDWILRRMPRYTSIAAGLTTLTVILVVVLPVLTLGWISVKETMKVYPVVQEWIRDARGFSPDRLKEKLPPRVAALWDKGRDYFDRLKIEPQEFLLQGLDQLRRFVQGVAASALKNMFFIAFNLLVLSFTLFFFLRDGPYIIRRGVELVPMAHRNKKAILQRLQLTLFALFRGVLVVAVLQGIMATLGYVIIGVPFSVLLGALTMFLAVIPFFGPTTIWIPVSIGLALSGAYEKAVFVALWGMCVVSFIDNFMRPLLVSADARLPILLMFFGMLGGLKIYGFSGLLLGPVIIALVMTFIDIYRREYRGLIAPQEPSPRKKRA